MRTYEFTYDRKTYVYLRQTILLELIVLGAYGLCVLGELDPLCRVDLTFCI
jgi:hypothetical protein